MTKKFCDCIGCQEEATMTAKMPRSIVRRAMAWQLVELLDTDLCTQHVITLSEFFNEVMK